MKKLVWFAEIKWDYLVTRKQQILKRFPDDWQILYIEPYVVGKKQHWLPHRDGNLTIITIPFLKTIPQSLLTHIQDIHLTRLIMGFIGTIYFKLISLILGFGGQNRLIGLSSLFWGKVAARERATVHFYDANDAHLDFPGTPVWLEGYLSAYMNKADLSFAVSPEIQQSIEKYGARNIDLLGNGVDYEHFSTPQARPDLLQNIKKPILGYAGAMDWIDEELVAKICRAYPDHEIVLIGPEISPGWFKSRKAFTNLSNLQYLGKVDYEILPAFVQSFSVGLIPFVVDELTKPLNPNKLYEYSAAGKPVVSMNYSSTIDGLKDVIFVGNTHEEFVERVGEALLVQTDSRRMDLAKHHSWDNVAQKMVSSLIASMDLKR